MIAGALGHASTLSCSGIDSDVHNVIRVEMVVARSVHWIFAQQSCKGEATEDVPADLQTV